MHHLLNKSEYFIKKALLMNNFTETDRTVEMSVILHWGAFSLNLKLVFYALIMQN